MNGPSTRIAPDRHRPHFATAAALAALGLFAAAPPALAGAFIFAGDANGLDLVTHPTGYSGTGGAVSVSVCIDPASPNALAMEDSVRNIVQTLNEMSPELGNVVIPSPELGSSEVDFESVALHEVGHCIGLAHPNAATESGLSPGDRDYTKATAGLNDTFDLDAGTDTVIGSSDDVRGDDENLHWYRMSNNDPFTVAETVDSSTYARDTASLPPGHLFAANASRDVATLLGHGSSECVMQQGSFFDEVQRILGHDDAATLLYARSGLDSVSGNGDDYTVELTYAGQTTSCDVVLAFDNSETGFAVCQVSGSFLSADDAAITSANVFFNTGFSWFFNDLADELFADGFESGDTTRWE